MEESSHFQKLTSLTKIESKKDYHFEEFFQSLHKQRIIGGYLVANYQGSWFDADLLKGVLTFQKHFQAKNSDIILATAAKSGTTWLKALIFSIVNRNKHSVAESPLLFSNPHKLVHFLEINLYKNGEIPDIESIPCPRIFATHLPYQCLSNSILESSECRIIYLCRNPLDIFTSLLHFSLQNGLLQEAQSMSLDEAVDAFGRGVMQYGPFWDHVLGYWNARLKNPQKILFLKFEDLKKDILSCVKKIANFLDYPFSADEEKEGLVEEIIKLCSFENLKNLEVNKEGEVDVRFNSKNSSFFRKGEVGDWINHLTPSMAEGLQKLMKEEFSGSGLTFDIHDDEQQALAMPIPSSSAP